MTDTPAAKVIEAYLLLRDKRAERAAAFKAEDDVDKEKQTKLENWLLKNMEEVGTDTLKTKGIGTAFRQLKVRYNCTDWTNFWPKMAELGRFDFMEKRLSAKAVAEYLAEPDAEELPGITSFNEYTVTVRRG